MREITIHLGMVLGGTTFLVTLGAAVQASSKSQGAPVWVPLTLIPLIVGNALPYLIPVALLTAAVLTYGRMAADGEDLVLRAAGVRPIRLLIPALLAGLVVAFLAYPLAASILPDLYSRMRELSFRLRFAALENTNPGSSELHFRGLHLTWRGRDDRGAFRDVILALSDREDKGVFAFDPGPSQPTPNSDTKPDKTAKSPTESEEHKKTNQEAKSQKPEAHAGTVRVRAERASMQLQDRNLVLALRGITTFSDKDQDSSWSGRGPGVTTVKIDLDGLGQRDEKSLKPDDFTSAELRHKLSEERLKRKVRGRYRYTLWRRFSMAMSALPLALVGALLGWKLRRGGILTAFAAAFGVVLIVFYPLFYLGNGLEQTGTLDPVTAAFLPILGLTAVLGLLWFGGRR